MRTTFAVLPFSLTAAVNTIVQPPIVHSGTAVLT